MAKRLGKTDGTGRGTGGQEPPSAPRRRVSRPRAKQAGAKRLSPDPIPPELALLAADPPARLSQPLRAASRIAALLGAAGLFALQAGPVAAQLAGVTDGTAGAGAVPGLTNTPSPDSQNDNQTGSPAGTQAAKAPARVSTPIRRDQPAYYQADTATYDRETGIATLTGHVEFWQDDRVLLADRVTYDRNTDVAAASGHVVLLEPDGQTVFSDYSELTGGMKDGVMSGIRVLLTQNGKLAANGGRRTDAHINELSRAVYSTCNVCATDPGRPPLWQIRARDAIQDTEHKLIEYRDAVVEMYGIPVFYTPYLSHPDPSEKRASGLLVPTIGYSSHLGAFTEVPYYWVIDGQSDATITPVIASDNGPGVFAQYRHRFNDGTVSIDGSLANEHGGIGANVYAKGQFALDDTWRWGFDINRASSSQYVNDYRIANSPTVLTSSVYLEGFGQGSYSRLDARAYQGLTSSVSTNALPVVLPRYEYSFVGQADSIGGRLAVDAGAFNVLRYAGTSTQRASFSTNYGVPYTGPMGDVWTFTLHEDSAAYIAHGLDQQPNFSPTASAESTQVMPTAAAMVRLPLLRDGGSWGSQMIEPIVQLIAAPNSTSYTHTLIPNEDSLDQEFTSDNLFALNRFPGIDRLEGGMRANVALHGAWYAPDGQKVDALVGQAYRLKKDDEFAEGSGLRDTASDIVTHLSYTPNGYFDLDSHQRFDRRTFNTRFADVLASAGPQSLKVTAGYLYTYNNPYTLYEYPAAEAPLTSPRNEVSLGVGTKYGPFKFGISGQRDVRLNKMDAISATAAYEDECFIFNVNLYRRYTSLNNDNGATTVLFQITLKTVGAFGFNAS